ncbi:hypothetical protein AB1Y20_002295 [Prymnesium parvum]|uniref:ZZ-type domain-containing protein n=1 Tax=Prymnesium parvum TaxID=97485 RepID=A0AB34J7K8_PRYPA
MQPKCPSLHRLSRCRNRVPNLVCDGRCGRGRIAVYSWRWSCDLCDFDVCEECATQLAVETDAAHPLSQPTPKSSSDTSHQAVISLSDAMRHQFSACGFQ